MILVYDIEVYANNKDFTNKKTAKELVPYSIALSHFKKVHRKDAKQIQITKVYRHYDDFFDYISTIDKSKNLTVFSFNGLNYENYFLLKYFIKDRKFTQVFDLKKVNGTFSALIRDDKKAVVIDLYYNDKKIRFVDVCVSLSIQKSYKAWIKERLKIDLAKDGIDHKKFHDVNSVLTDEEMTYIKDDVEPFLHAVSTYDKDELKAITFQSYGIKKLVKQSIPVKRKGYEYANFRHIFPVLKKAEADFLRFKGIHGGISGTNPLYAGRKVYGALKLDIHSSYPSRHIMNQVPKGKGIYAQYQDIVYRTYDKLNYCYICRIKYKIGKTVNFPFFVGENEPSEAIKLDTLYLSPDKHELQNFFKCYPDGEISVIEGYFYRMIDSPFKNSVLTFYNEKQQGNEKSKLLLNACSYGKFAENTHLYNYMITPEMEFDKKPLKEEKEGRYTYLPIALCITQLSRNQLMETAYEIGFKAIVQYDTDSLVIHTKMIKKNIDYLIGPDIGKWGVEKEYVLFKGLWSKHYIGFGYNFKKKRYDVDGACAGYHIDYNYDTLKMFNNDFMVKQLQANKSILYGVYLLEIEKKFNKQNEIDERISDRDIAIMKAYEKRFERQHTLQPQ